MGQGHGEGAMETGRANGQMGMPRGAQPQGSPSHGEPKPEEWLSAGLKGVAGPQERLSHRRGWATGDWQEWPCGWGMHRPQGRLGCWSWATRAAIWLGKLSRKRPSSEGEQPCQEQPQGLGLSPGRQWSQSRQRRVGGREHKPEVGQATGKPSHG